MKSLEGRHVLRGLSGNFSWPSSCAAPGLLASTLARWEAVEADGTPGDTCPGLYGPLGSPGCGLGIVDLGAAPDLASELLGDSPGRISLLPPGDNVGSDSDVRPAHLAPGAAD